jgi:hypothetical protein
VHFEATAKMSPAFERRNTQFERGKPLIEFGRGVTAKNALAQHGLAEAVNAFLEFFLVSVDLIVQRPDCAADFSE